MDIRDSLKQSNNFVNSGLNLDEIKRLLEENGLQFIAKSGRTLVKSKYCERYFKLEGHYKGENLKEFENWQKLKLTKYEKHFAKCIDLIDNNILEIEFIKGNDVNNFFGGDYIKYTFIMNEVQSLLINIRKELGIDFEDIHGGNIIATEDSWKIIDYVEYTYFPIKTAEI